MPVTIAGSLMLATSAVSLFLSWGMLAVMAVFATAPKPAVRMAAVTPLVQKFTCPDITPKPFGTYIPNQKKAQELSLYLQETALELGKSLDIYARGQKGREQARQKIKDISQYRKNILTELLSHNPLLAARALLTAQEESRLNELSNNCVGKKARHAGTLEVRVADFFDRGFGLYDYRLKTAQGRTLTLRPVSGSEKLLSGTEVEVDGIEIGDEVLTDFSRGINQPNTEIGGLRIIQNTNNPPVYGDQKTLVVMANFRNTAQPSFTAEQAQSVMDEVRNYYQENSYNKITLSGFIDAKKSADILGWHDIPLFQTCDYEAVEKEAVKAVDANVNFKNYSRLVVIAPFPDAVVCGWAGIAQVDKVSVPTADGPAMMSVASINLSYANLLTIAHELGHGFGNLHANFYHCGDGVPGTSACEELEYSDPYDVMGFYYAGHYNAIHKEETGWLEPSSVLTISGNGEYPLKPIESDAAGVKALKIPRTGRGNYLYIEYRQPLGYDNQFTGADRKGEMHDTNVYGGALIHTPGEMGTRLIDPIPPSQNFLSALTADKPYRDALTGTTLSIVSQTPDALIVGVKEFKIVTENFSPHAGILSPLNGETVSGIIAVTAWALDENGIERVEFYTHDPYYGAAPRVTDYSEPYAFELDTTRMPNGRGDLYVVAYDTTGKRSESIFDRAFKIKNADPNPPTNVIITSPADNSTFNSSISVTAAAEDDVGVWKIEFWIDQGENPFGGDYFRPNAVDNNPPFAADISLGWIPAGLHTLRAKVYDYVGNVTESEAMNFTIEEKPPLVKILEPLEGQAVGDPPRQTFSIGIRDDTEVSSLTTYFDDRRATTLYGPFTGWVHEDSYNIVGILGYVDAGTPDGPHALRAVAAKHPFSAEAKVNIVVRIPTFRRGDADGSGAVDVSDAIYTLEGLFLKSGTVWSCEDAADSNDDGKIDLSDSINTLGYLFTGEGDIPLPGPLTLGRDLTTWDLRGCSVYPKS